MQDVVLQFKNMQGSNGYPARKLVQSLALSSDSFYRKDMSHNLFKKRMEFVEQGTNSFFQSIDCDNVDVKPLDNGAESLVFDCNDDYVLKIRRGKPYIRRNFSKLLQPVQSEYSQELDINYEILPKVQKKGARIDQIMGLIVKSAMSGFIINDPAQFNFGWVKDKQNQKDEMVIIDRGAVYKGQNYVHDMAYAGYSLIKAVAVPLYINMPFLHEPWRNFKANIKSMTSYNRGSEFEPTNTPSPQP